MTGASAVTAGYVHTLVVKTDGTVWAWGLNVAGELGNPTICIGSTSCFSRTPIQVIGLTGARQTAAGRVNSQHSLALTSGGSIIAHAFQDANKNGQQDASEGVLSGWTITLYQIQDTGCGGTVLASRATDTNGNAAFSSLADGQYGVAETWRAGWINTTLWCQVTSLQAGQSIILPFGNSSEPKAVMQPPTAGFVGYLFRMRFADLACDTSQPINTSIAHTGVDIWTNTAGGGTLSSSPEGTAVYSAAAGQVVQILDGSNNPATIKAPDPNNPKKTVQKAAVNASILVINNGRIQGTRVTTIYAHMGNADGKETYIDGSIYVNEQVGQGALLGHQGNAFGIINGVDTNPARITHLHFEMQTNGKNSLIDPSPYIGRQVNRCVAGYPGWKDIFP